MSKLAAIGDVHGELEKLENLISKLNLKRSDKIIFLGDYIDRGENSRGVVDFILDLQKRYDVICLKGNHEQFVTDIMGNRESNMIGSWLMNGGYATLGSYGGSFKLLEEIHGNFYKELNITYETENHIFVHGWLHHKKDLSDQVEEACLWSRFDDIKPHKSGKTVVCGHTIQKWEPTDLGYKICIDTGSFKEKGCITALVIEGDDQKFVNSR